VHFLLDKIHLIFVLRNSFSVWNFVGQPNTVKKKYTKFELQIHDPEEEIFNPSVTQSNTVTVTFFHIPDHVFHPHLYCIVRWKKKQKTGIDIYCYFKTFNYYFPSNIYYFYGTAIKVSWRATATVCAFGVNEYLAVV